jgi:hypothetical protein
MYCITKRALICLFISILFIGWNIFNPTTADAAATQWNTQEIQLTAAGQYTNPYTQVDLSATFTGPDGRQLRVKGFWDGGSTFKIRFTPTLPGAWTYTTNATLSDSGLSKSGSITVSAPVSGNHGFLRRDTANPQSFVWDDGTRYFMWGQTYYGIVRTARVSTAWKTAVANSKAHGMNKIRMLLYPWIPPADDHYPDTQPFKDTTSSSNHDSLNLAHWQTLDDIVRYLESERMVADLIIFADTPRAFGSKTQDDRYARYALARYGAFHNVIWCLTNEWNYTNKPQSYWDSIGTIIRQEDPWMTEGGALRPLSIHQQTRIDFQFFGASWPSHAIIQYGVRNGQDPNGDQWGNASITRNLGHNMPVVNDEYGYLGETSPIDFTQTQARQAIWGIATAGGYGSAGDGRTFGTFVAYRGAEWHDAPEYDDIKHMVDFFTTNNIPYWRMVSQNSLVNSGTRVYVLGLTGAEYVVYSANGDTFKLNLPGGLYQAKWFDPATGTTKPGKTVMGGVKSFTSPFSNDAVLYLSSGILPVSLILILLFLLVIALFLLALPGIRGWSEAIMRPRRR